MIFRGEYGFLSNMYPCKIKDDFGLEYSCVESAFQAAKTDKRDERIPFTQMDGVTAKKAGRKLNLIPNWDSKKVDVMRMLLQQKFAVPELMTRLQNIHEEIVENNTWHDTFWGRCNGIGKNVLGTLLMEIRDKRKEHSMQEINYPHSLFFLPKNKTEAVAVTTNGQVRSDGSAVMGKGQALEATKWFKDIDKRLGMYMCDGGNRVYNMGVYGDDTREMTVLTFPTKEHWKDKSSLSLIQQSAQELKEAADFYKLSKVYLPLVGCGCGGLDYQTEVRPLLMNILDDRFVVVQGYKG